MKGNSAKHAKTLRNETRTAVPYPVLFIVHALLLKTNNPQISQISQIGRKHGPCLLRNLRNLWILFILSGPEFHHLFALGCAEAASRARFR